MWGFFVHVNAVCLLVPVATGATCEVLEPHTRAEVLYKCFSLRRIGVSCVPRKGYVRGVAVYRCIAHSQRHTQCTIDFTQIIKMRGIHLNK